MADNDQTTQTNNDQTAQTKTVATSTETTKTVNPSLHKKKLNLELAPAAYGLLQKLVDETGKSMVDILRTGLALYGIAHDAIGRGQSIGIIEGDKVIKEILIP
jgi:hypothetical protein